MKRVKILGESFAVHVLPEWAPMGGITLFGHVFLKARLVDDDVLLRHEAIHVRDQRTWTILFWLTYLLLPIPGPFTLRGFWEWRAYRETIRATIDHQGSISDYQKGLIIAWLSGPLYWWAMPRSFARRLVEREVTRLTAMRKGNG